ncbi:putative DNA binding domain-containing protein [Frankia sp. AgB1.9]|uniref:ATP-binding protein n=1 Tax=unclassified Frankia TaxID=2632575 RepID=UPI001934B259|nr:MULTISPECIES: ATP-binding protein [unclassified Frankia]MBL7488215.1 putative DNA binding domain-containing protein [Frankia sp. AgW1.1]MBL7548142.1 putative DNA binding domain-containing protein [Frankia sp. AgB1.9]MBL7620368.1 putative DNA binding domain-containing protein [Frankia sp. AgB1.8]
MVSSREGIRREAERAIAEVLGGRPAAQLESVTLDFKELKRSAGNDRDPLRAAAIDLAEAAACLANSRGGTVIVGVSDTGSGSEAFVGVPNELDIDHLRRRIWELSSPPLVVDLEDRTVDERRVLLLAVEPGFDLVRVGGKLRERIGTSCEPLTADREAAVREERRGYDWSVEQTQLTLGDVSARALEEARRLLVEAGDAQSRRRAELGNADLLRECGVLTSEGVLTRAGALLFCGSPGLAADPSLHYLRRRTPGGSLARPPSVHDTPLIVAIVDVLRSVDAINETTSVTLPTGVQQQLETIPELAVREAIVNAVAHRDYRHPEPIVIEHSPSRLVVTSPGDLVFGVTEENILTHVSKPRNRCLIDALRVLRLAERAGTGVDVMVRSMVRAGHTPPVFNSGGGSVRVVLDGGAPVARVSAMIASLPSEIQDDTDAILIIHHLRSHATIDATTIAPILQKSVEESAEALRRLSDDAYDLLEPARETRRFRLPTYRFRERIRVELGTVLPYHRNTADETERRIVAHLREYGTISNQTVQNLLLIGVQRASVILRSLAERGIIQRTENSPTRGPGVRYEPGPHFPTRRRAH